MRMDLVELLKRKLARLKSQKRSVMAKVIEFHAPKGFKKDKRKKPSLPAQWGKVLEFCAQTTKLA